jgi:hypothetical protein
MLEMRRFFTTLIMIAFAAGTVAAQDAAFRFASDPFSADEAKTTDSEKVSGQGNNPVKQATSYDSYESGSASAKSLVQKKAMFRAEQRQLRIASRKWYGFSQSRPAVLAAPHMTTYNPIWVGRNWTPYFGWYGRAWY